MAPRKHPLLVALTIISVLMLGGFAMALDHEAEMQRLKNAACEGSK